MFDKRIEQMFEQMRREMMTNFGSQTNPWTENRVNLVSGEADGYKVEMVDGEVTEYIYEDGEWEEIGGDSDESVQISDLDEGFELTVDVNNFDELRGFAPTDVSASFNNGILSVEMEHSTEEELDE